jgi:hypothetical protein
MPPAGPILRKPCSQCPAYSNGGVQHLPPPFDTFIPPPPLSHPPLITTEPIGNRQVLVGWPIVFVISLLALCVCVCVCSYNRCRGNAVTCFWSPWDNIYDSLCLLLQIFPFHSWLFDFSASFIISVPMKFPISYVFGVAAFQQISLWEFTAGIFRGLIL